MDECRKQFEQAMHDVFKTVVGSNDPYPAGLERDYWKVWQAAWNRRESGQVEPVAWMHNLPGRVDVIHTEVKNLLARQAVESHQGFHRPLDKTEHYTIPLYDHAKPCARCAELEATNRQLNREVISVGDEAEDYAGKLAALEAENKRQSALISSQGIRAMEDAPTLDKLATLEAELSGLRARYLRMESEYEATVAQQAEQLAAAESRLHDVATHCATVEQQLAAAEKDAERYRWLRSNHPIHDNSPFICRNFGAAFSQWTGDQADKAIDAAIAASREGKS